MYIIGIDIGTSSTKAVAVNANGDVLITSQVPYPTMNSLPGMSEQDPELVWHAFVKCIQRITAALKDKPAAIALSSAMHSLICVDEEGRALSNLITWADSRSAAVASELKTSPAGIQLYRETGTPIHAMSPLCKLLWMKEAHPEMFLKSSRFISIKEYCWFKLFREFQVDYSIASATGLFNIKTCRWHEAALALLGLSTARLSAPVNTNYFRDDLTVAGAAELNVAVNTKVFIGGSDGCLANVGSFATRPGIAALTIGTSGAIRVAGALPVVNDTHMPFNYRLNENIFISGGPINNGGVALKWFAESLLGKVLSTRADYESILAPAENIKAGSDGLVFLPYLLGERAPIWNSETCGVFFGMTARHKQAHFTRAVLEGITFSLYAIARALESGGLEIKELRVSGGFVRSEIWVQLLTNIFGKRVSLSNIDDASAIGAALIAMETLNIPHKMLEKAQTNLTTFEPDHEMHTYYRDNAFPAYEHLYRSLVLDMKQFHVQTTASLTRMN